MRTWVPSRIRSVVYWFAIWLVFLAYPVADLIQGRLRGLHALAGWAELVVFVAVYLTIALHVPWGPRGPRAAAEDRQVQRLVVQLVALSLVMAFTNGINWIGLLIYCSVILAATRPVRQAVVAVGVVSALALVDSLVFHAGASSTAFFVFMVAAIGSVVMGVQRMAMLVTELREAQAEVARLAVSEERLRFARDLHDLLGHSLSLIVLKSELVRRVMERDPDAAAREIRELEAVARQSLVEVREAVTGYRSRSLADELELARSALASAGVEPVLHLGPGAAACGDEAESVLGWAVREGVTNVVRHSGARRCEIRIRREGGSATVEVLDDGSAAPGPPGSGLRGLGERLALAGGVLETGPAAGGGFRLVARVPVASDTVAAAIDAAAPQ